MTAIQIIEQRLHQHACSGQTGYSADDLRINGDDLASCHQLPGLGADFIAAVNIAVGELTPQSQTPFFGPCFSVPRLKLDHRSYMSAIFATIGTLIVGMFGYELGQGPQLQHCEPIDLTFTNHVHRSVDIIDDQFDCALMKVADFCGKTLIDLEIFNSWSGAATVFYIYRLHFGSEWVLYPQNRKAIDSRGSYVTIRTQLLRCIQNGLTEPKQKLQEAV
mgnify:CR=1 FL=1